MTEIPNESIGKTYEIRLEGHLNESWAEWLDGLVFSHESDGTTRLTGEVIDQAALHAVTRFKFKPREVGGERVRVENLQLKFAFNLDSLYEVPEEYQQ